MFAKFNKGKIELRFNYDPDLVKLIKTTGVHEWHPAGKFWTVKPTLEGLNFVVKNNFAFTPDDQINLVKAIDELLIKTEVKKVKFALSKSESADAIPSVQAQLKFDIAPFQWVPCNYVKLHDKAYFLLADDMGTGKTIQAITVTLLPELNVEAVLVICPAGVTYNWQKELKEKFGQESVVIDKTWKGVRIPGIKYYIASFERSKKVEAIFDFVIIDEAHYIKKKSTERYKAAKRHIAKAKCVMALTGTPIENRPMEAHTFLTLLDPDCPTWYAFAEKYCGLKRKYYGDKSFLDYSGATNLTALHDYLYSTCTIRRTKKQVLNQLPDLTRQVIDLGSEELNGDNIFTLYKNNSEAKQENAAFLEWMSETLLTGQKCLVFTHHIDFQEKLASLCKTLKLSYITINGNTPAKKRQELVDQFNADPNITVALLSITAASTGINLQSASVVIFAELYFVMTVLMQAEARAHRMGQKNSVMVYLPVFSKFEKAVLELLLEKMTIFAKAIDGLGNETDIKDQSLLKQLSKELGIPIGMEKKL